MQIRMGIRQYDPSYGRFTSVDPLKGTPTDPQQRNRYTYTGNNPLTRYDLDGRAWYNPGTWLDDEENDKNQDPNSLLPSQKEYMQAGDPTLLSNSAVGAGIDLAQEQTEMLIKNDKGYSLYYYCVANYKATSRGYTGRQTSRLLGLVKEEIIDDFRHLTDDDTDMEDYLIDKDRDSRVNERARKCAMEGHSLNEACPYIPDDEFQTLVGM